MRKQTTSPACLKNLFYPWIYCSTTFSLLNPSFFEGISKFHCPKLASLRLSPTPKNGIKPLGKPRNRIGRQCCKCGGSPSAFDLPTNRITASFGIAKEKNFHRTINNLHPFRIQWISSILGVDSPFGGRTGCDQLLECEQFVHCSWDGIGPFPQAKACILRKQLFQPTIQLWFGIYVFYHKSPNCPIQPVV